MKNTKIIASIDPLASDVLGCLSRKELLVITAADAPPVRAEET
jgi:hypothetical protein